MAKKVKSKSGGYYSHQSICWECGRCYRGCGCEWSDSFTPVAGWVARLSTDRQKPPGTYHVYECPKFTKDCIESKYKVKSAESFALMGKRASKIPALEKYTKRK